MDIVMARSPITEIIKGTREDIIILEDLFRIGISAFSKKNGELYFISMEENRIIVSINNIIVFNKELNLAADS